MTVAGGLIVGAALCVLLVRCTADEPPAQPKAPAADAHSGGTGGYQWDAGSYDAPPSDGPPPADAPVDVAPLDANAPGYEWLFGDAWTAVPTHADCNAAVADVTKLDWPGFDWQGCGEGCLRAEAVNGPEAIFKGARRVGSGSQHVGGELMLYLAAGVRLPPALQWAAAISPKDWRPVSILRTYGDECTPSFSGNYTQVAQILAGDGKATLAHVTTSGVILASPPAPLTSPRRYFDFDGGWGYISGQATVAVSHQLDSTVFTSVYSSSGYAEIPKGVGAGVFWRDWTNVARLFVWTKAGGPRPLVQGAFSVTAFAVNSGKLAWLAATGDPLQGIYDSVHVHSSPLQLDPDLVVPSAGIVVPVSGLAEPMHLAGSWVVMRDLGTRILLVNLSTKEVWGIDAPVGHYQTALGLSETQLVVADSPPAVIQPSQNFYNIIRYDLSKLSSYATKLP